MREKLSFALLLLLSFLASDVLARSAFSGRVVHVADGDTLTVLAPGNQQVKVRLYGVDCPEKKQAFGRQALNFTIERVAGRPVAVDMLDTDQYGRTVGLVRSEDGGILNQELLTNGLAWHYGRSCKASFCRQWKKDELRARQARKGLWRDGAPVEPWIWRKTHKRR